MRGYYFCEDPFGDPLVDKVPASYVEQLKQQYLSEDFRHYEIYENGEGIYFSADGMRLGKMSDLTYEQWEELSEYGFSKSTERYGKFW